MKIINDRKNPNEEIHWDFFYDGVILGITLQ